MTAVQPITDRTFQTKQAQAHAAIRDAIAKVRLKPGDRLVIDDLAKILGMSAIPVREALQMLQSERLVDIKPHTGAVVAPIAPSAVAEVFALMEALETAAARAAIPRATAADAAHLLDLHQQMEATARKTGDRWAELNREFHLAFARIAGQPLTCELLERVTSEWDRLRRLRYGDRAGADAVQAGREHAAMIKALEKKDVETLERLVRDHNRGALKLYETEKTGG